MHYLLEESSRDVGALVIVAAAKDLDRIVEYTWEGFTRTRIRGWLDLATENGDIDVIYWGYVKAIHAVVKASGISFTSSDLFRIAHRLARIHYNQTHSCDACWDARVELMQWASELGCAEEVRSRLPELPPEVEE